jgi:hypothetical protein
MKLYSIDFFILWLKNIQNFIDHLLLFYLSLMPGFQCKEKTFANLFFLKSNIEYKRNMCFTYNITNYDQMSWLKIMIGEQTVVFL